MAEKNSSITIMNTKNTRGNSIIATDRRDIFISSSTCLRIRARYEFLQYTANNRMAVAMRIIGTRYSNKWSVVRKVTINARRPEFMSR